MAKRSQVKQTFRDIDDGFYLFTGKRLRDIGSRGISLFGEQIAKKVTNLFREDVEVPDDSPYHVLGVNPDAPDFLIRAAYKAMQKKYHPDGETPNDVLSKMVNDAYDRIREEREMTK